MAPVVLLVLFACKAEVEAILDAEVLDFFLLKCLFDLSDFSDLTEVTDSGLGCVLIEPITGYQTDRNIFMPVPGFLIDPHSRGFPRNWPWYTSRPCANLKLIPRIVFSWRIKM